MIVGTAGHIDHGKTSLVKALTGVDTDRLSEEKARGITIDLGFAYKPIGEAAAPVATGRHGTTAAPSPGADGDGQVIGFVDVPGHEKLVRNMLAGATGIDHVLLVVAADDGPMPQTLEHVAILDLLGLEHGAVALTKADLVTPDRLAASTAEVRALLAGTGLAGAPIFPVSSITGLGLAELEAHLREAAATTAPRPDTEAPTTQPGPSPAARERSPRTGHFRLAVDRSFSLTGVGTIVTGTSVAGRVDVGDRLIVSPRGTEVRVRGIHAHNRPSDHGTAGQRLALNLAGVEKHDVQRGDWIVADAVHAPTQRFDARLKVLAGEPRALAHWTPVHLHLGAVDIGARVVALEGDAVAPGGEAIVQLHLDRPIGALRGDRFVLRDQSALRTIGGGVVLDPFVPDTRRRRAQRLDALRALEAASPEDALRALLALEQPGGIDIGAFATAWNLLPAHRQALLDAVAHRRLGSERDARLFATAHVERFEAAVTAQLTSFHQKSPDSPGLAAEALQRAAKSKPVARLFAPLIQGMVDAGTLKRTGAHLHLPGHEATLQGLEKQIWERMKPWLDEAGIAPPKLSDLLERDRSLRKDQVMRTLQRLERMGKVHLVGAEYAIQTHHMLELALVSQKLVDKDPNKRLNVKELRDATGMSRHLSVPLVEHFDKIGFTKRDEVGRHIKRDPHRMFGA
jgi:selenocysteine-specific elongation factor